MGIKVEQNRRRPRDLYAQHEEQDRRERLEYEYDQSEPDIIDDIMGIKMMRSFKSYSSQKNQIG
ncbi:hypothetical protein FRX31_009546 [Thalictrum thalictroides]|uniref:Uncharacterized protein n=1 Tax=Thalictrum thalictroides TaxID=46969 RepID=A0A7J6WTX3_THATH|nr:hypothetical protein FRX31_009546 [Thalictrum thalictroides]